jgi:hypothetical protein
VTETLGKLLITALPFHAAEVGVAYAPAALGATGGKQPYSWSLSSGALPTGLALSSDGKVSGTPASAGSFSFVVRVDDASGHAAGVPKSLTVARHLAVSGLCATRPCSVERGCTTVCGTFGSQADGVGPFTYVRTGGALPPTTSLSHLSLAGTFTTASKYSFAVKVTDSLGASGSVTAAFTVFPHIAFSVKLGACGPSYGCSTSLPYTMGTPGGTPRLSFTTVVCPATVCTGIAPEPRPNTLPKVGFSASAARGIVTITFGLPGASTYGDWVGYIYVTITDQSPCGPGPTLCSATVRVNVDTETKYG